MRLIDLAEQMMGLAVCWHYGPILASELYRYLDKYRMGNSACIVGETLGLVPWLVHKLDHELGSYSFYQAVPFYSAPVAVTAGRCGLQCNLTSTETDNTSIMTQWRYSIPESIPDN